VLELGAGEWGWEWYRYYSAENKVKYLLTQVTDGKVRGSCVEADERVRMLANVVRDFTGCELQLRDSDGYIDHQSASGDRGTGLELFEDPNRLKAFIFNADSYIETGNDNGVCPWVIPTDRGDEQTYKSRFSEVPRDFVPMKMAIMGEMNRSVLTTAAGGILRSGWKTGLYGRVVAEGIVTYAEWKREESYDAIGREDVRGFTARALSLAKDGRGFLLSPDMVARKEWIKTDDMTQREVQLSFVVQLPAAMAVELAGLDPTGASQWMIDSRMKECLEWTKRAKGKSADSWEAKNVVSLRRALMKVGGRKALAQMDAKKKGTVGSRAKKSAQAGDSH
jgi:hypothetical protein